MYYLHYYWPGGPMTNPGYPAYYNYPAQFGFDWENIDGVTPTGNAAYYPYHYWGYYYNSYHGGAAGTTFAPPEGYVGLFGSYNVCLDYAYSYYMSPGQGARLTYPIVDISASNITKVTLWMDVLHNRADNYQDRYDFVARSGNDPAELGNYVRESGTALFKDGTITGADTGIEIGGAFAAAHFDNVDVTNPVNSGMEIVGQTAATSTGLEVTGGTYGVLSGTSSSGSIDLLDLDLDGQHLLVYTMSKILQEKFLEILLTLLEPHSSMVHCLQGMFPLIQCLSKPMRSVSKLQELELSQCRTS